MAPFNFFSLRLREALFVWLSPCCVKKTFFLFLLRVALSLFFLLWNFPIPNRDLLFILRLCVRPFWSSIKQWRPEKDVSEIKGSGVCKMFWKKDSKKRHTAAENKLVARSRHFQVEKSSLQGLPREETTSRSERIGIKTKHTPKPLKHQKLQLTRKTHEFNRSLL